MENSKENLKREAPFKVRHYSDSLGIPRFNTEKYGNERVTYEHTYIYKLQQLWRSRYQDVQFVQASKGGFLINDIVNEYYDHDFCYGPGGDVLILHEGICDCAPRPLNNDLKQRINRLPGAVKKRIVKLIHKNRAFILSNVNTSYNTNIESFGKLYDEFLTAVAGKYKRVYVITISRTFESMEKHSPGYNSSVDKYNAAIEKSCGKFGKDGSIILIDTNTCFRESGHSLEKILLNDGHHISFLGHQLIYDEIMKTEINT